MDKLCPGFVIANFTLKEFKFDDGTSGPGAKCRREKCQLWTRAWTTENIQIFDCAFVVNAMKNSEGKIVV